LAFPKGHLGKFPRIDYIPGQLQVSQRMAKKEKIMMVSRHVLILVGSLSVTISALAADVPVERKVNDRQIIDLLADIHNRGAALFNRGDMMGSYRLFEGSLRTIQPLLPADLQGEVTMGLVKAERQMDPTTKALALHELIETVRKKLYPTAGPKGTKLPSPKPLTFDEPELAPKTNNANSKPLVSPLAKPVSNPSSTLPLPDPVPLPLDPLPLPREVPNIPSVENPVKPKNDPVKADAPKDEGLKIEFPPIESPKNDLPKKEPTTKIDQTKIDPPKKPMPDVQPKPITIETKDQGPNIFPLPK
jgi:hypothetical protein